MTIQARRHSDSRVMPIGLIPTAAMAAIFRWEVPAMRGTSFPMVVWLCVAVGLCSFVNCAPEQGQLTRSAEYAKQQGRSTALVQPVHDYIGADPDLRATLERYSFVIATATAKLRVQVLKDTILTWHEFRAAEWLAPPSRPGASVQPCFYPTPWPLRILSADRLAVPLEFGRARIYGVDVTVDSVDTFAPIVEGDRYLMIARQCGPRAWEVAFGLFGMMRVTTDQRLQPLIPMPRRVLPELFELGTVEKAREYLAAMRFI